MEVGMNSMRNTKGFSLVELAIGLAVITILILAVSLSSGIHDNARVQSAANSVQALMSAAQNYLVSGHVNYAGLTVDTLKTAKVLPDNFTAVKSNPWGGDFILLANASNNARFDVGLTGLAKSDADKLTAYFSNNASAMAFDATKNTWTGTF